MLPHCTVLRTRTAESRNISNEYLNLVCYYSCIGCWSRSEVGFGIPWLVEGGEGRMGWWLPCSLVFLRDC